MSVAQKNYYKILQVDPSADFAVIKAAYRTLMLELKNHPDYGGHTHNAQDINEAYTVLKDPIRRKEYDRYNYFSLKQSNQRSSQREYYYMRCFFCGTINRINLSTTREKLKGITCGKCHSPFFSEQLDNHKIKRQKRSHERYICDFDIKIQLKFGGEYYQGKCKDFSSKGMFFSTKTKLEQNRIIKIIFCHDERFQTIAKVLRVRRLINDDGEIYECAALFIEAQCDKSV
ncbi:MAG: DnaJ domain-containing protein [Candidatus Auribacterota bacterium]|jgi:DnaJ-class molecular chaperone|nr:DnaJ domain-containing protein [Candidatus Auribacterota bacterium]